MKKQQWKCPECGYSRLYPIGRNTGLWECNSSLCFAMFYKKTIQALMWKNYHQLLGEKTAAQQKIVNPLTGVAGLYKKAVSGFEAYGTFTTSPPGFQMPWETVQASSSDTARCECGGPTIGEPHAKWCLSAPKPPANKCECGSSSIGGAGHSTWCPLFQGDK